MLSRFLNLFKSREVPDEEKRLENGRLLLDVIRGNPELINMCSSEGAISEETAKRLMLEVENGVPSTYQKYNEAVNKLDNSLKDYNEKCTKIKECV